jgi:hypothetical protein
MDTFFRTHTYLVEHVNAPVRRALMDEIDWNDRLIGIKGTRGVGKTTFLLQYAKERYGALDRQCLYINMNNFYFQGRGIADFAGEFYRNGGKTLLIDQVFKQPSWSAELRKCYDSYPSLRIVFTGSSVMRLKEENPELNGIVKSYNLLGFSFREYLNLKAGLKLKSYSLEEILSHHESIAREVLSKVNPLIYFQDYLHHGFYPFFLEHRNFSENLLKTMNMMIEVDILLIKQIELKYLTKIKDLFYLLALGGPKAPNISSLASSINTSRATVMNYIKNLADARLINIIYPQGQSFPKKPAKLMLHNTNLVHAIYPIQCDVQELMEIFLVNNLWSSHIINDSKKAGTYIVDGDKSIRVCDAKTANVRMNSQTYYAQYNEEIGSDNNVPLWLFGFLY